MATVQQDHGLPSPVASAQSPTPSYATSVSGAVASLPSQRHKPLLPGSPKEIALINYVDDKIRYIARRYATKYTNITTKANEAPGYTSFDQFINDLNPLIDLVWATGTSTLQIPYMLTFAGLIASYMTAFPFSHAVFGLLRRVDTAFSTLLRSTGTSGGLRHTVSMTEKVRIKSLVDETRVIAVHQASSAGLSTDADDTSVEETDDSDDLEAFDDTADEDDEHNASEHRQDDVPTAMALARIYESTMVILGDSLAQPAVPVMETDDSVMDTS